MKMMLFFKKAGRKNDLKRKKIRLKQVLKLKKNQVKPTLMMTMTKRMMKLQKKTVELQNITRSI
jgi:hypothetical protein